MKFFENVAQKMRAYTAKYGYACESCGEEIFTYPAVRFCLSCEEKLHDNDGLTCPKCGRMTVAQGVCLSCKSHPPQITRGFAPYVYRGETAALVNRIKNGRRRLVYAFAERMVETFAAHVSADAPLLVLPVPLTDARKKERGYNQAEDLAFAVLDELIKRGYEARVDTEVLEKTRETSQQKQLGQTGRAENVKGAYHVHKRKACQGKRVLLVDDIMTTGATGGECGRVLKGAGAREVFFLVVAALPEI